LTDLFERFGPPSIRLDGLRIWVHGRQFPDSDDYWDGNWLKVTANCGGNGATVSVTGPIIHLSELDRWLVQTEGLYRSLAGKANLDCMEPLLSVSLKAKSLGHIKLEVSITPNHLTQKHWFQFEIDQSYLPALVRQCRSLLGTYPIKSRPDQ
jgi:hypothetical protein